VRILRDFKCGCGCITERFVDADTAYFPCYKCGANAEKMISVATIRLDGTDADFPTAYDRWATIREKRHRQKKS